MKKDMKQEKERPKHDFIDKMTVKKPSKIKEK